MKKKFNRKRPRIDRKSTMFEPNHAYVANAMGFYLRGGGKITILTVTEKSYANFISGNEPPSAVDEFLNGM